MHALIIEDEALLALLIEDFLRDRGYTSFHIAANEADAVAAARTRCPDLITSDVRLASGCGISAVRSICSERFIPVIFVTGSEEEVRERAPDALVVAKPFTSAMLDKALARARPPMAGYSLL